MLAAWYKKFGSARDVLEVGELTEPAPAKGEVKIRVHSSAVNPSDVKKRLGSSPNLLDNGLVIPHSDGAGEIVEVGDDTLKHRIGERVWVFEAQHNRYHGTSAQFVCIPSNNAISLPKNIGYDIGAMMGIPAMTAHRCVFNSRIAEGCYVLITGGAGRVGHYAIQWAKKSGAFVIATASNSKSFKQCKKAGADVVFSHPSENFVEEILDYTKGKLIDKVIDGDFGVNFNHILNIIKPNGKISTYASMTDMKPTIPFYQMMNLNIELKMVFVYDMPQKSKDSAIEDITIALDDDNLVHRLHKQYELSEISQAHLKIEDKQATYGAVIIKP